MATDNQSYRVRPAGGLLTHARRPPPCGASMRCTRSGPWLVVEVAGELDLQAVPLLDELGSDPRFVTLDLHGVTFMDCSGLHALVNARSRAVAAGGSLRVAAPSREVQRLLRLTGLERAFPAFDTVAEATALRVAVDGADTGPRLAHPRRSGGAAARAE